MGMNKMTVKEARKLVKHFNNQSNPSEEDEFLFVEAMQFLIAEENNPRDMLELGGYYYELKRYEVALKYYEMAAEFDIDEADCCLGYVWYYGRTGEINYEKAFHYYQRSMNRGNLVSTYKVADMYKNGFFVKKDYARYVSMMEELYPKIKHANNIEEPLPEIFTRLARIRTEQGRKKEAIALYREAKPFLSQRIQCNPFFGNLNIMKWMLEELYALQPFDENFFDLFDLYYLLRKPMKVSFVFDNHRYEIESKMEDGECVVLFKGIWYRSVDEFIAKACIRGEKLTSVYDQLEDYEVIAWNESSI